MKCCGSAKYFPNANPHIPRANSVAIENVIYVKETKCAIMNGQFGDSANTGITRLMTKKTPSKTKIPKYNTNNQIKRDNIDSPNTQICARIFSCYGTGNSTKNVGGRY